MNPASPLRWAPEFISPSMQKRLDRTLVRLMSNRSQSDYRSQSAPHLRPVAEHTPVRTGQRQAGSLHADRLSVLSAPRGDPRTRMARQKDLRIAMAGGSAPSRDDRSAINARKAYDQRRRQLSREAGMTSSTPPTRFVHGKVAFSKPAKPSGGASAARAGSPRAAGGGAVRPAEARATTVIATAVVA